MPRKQCREQVRISQIDARSQILHMIQFAPCAKRTYGLSFGLANGETIFENDSKISAILIANMILEYGDVRPVLGSVRINHEKNKG